MFTFTSPIGRTKNEKTVVIQRRYKQTLLIYASFLAVIFMKSDFDELP